MKLTTMMIDLGGDTASLGLFGDITEDSVRPPHVQVTISLAPEGDTDALRRKAIERAISALDAARAALQSEQ